MASLTTMPTGLVIAEVMRSPEAVFLNIPGATLSQCAVTVPLQQREIEVARLRSVCLRSAGALFPALLFELQERSSRETVALQESPIRHTQKTFELQKGEGHGTRYNRIRAAKRRARYAGGELRNELGAGVRGSQFQSEPAGH